MVLAKRLSEKEKKVILKSFTEGKTVDELAKQFFCTKATITRNLKISIGKEKFKELINQALEQDPDNATLYFNLGVVTAQMGDNLNAQEYYLKAIELDSNLEAPYLNLVALILEGEAEIIDKMNSLGNSRSDNAKYDILKSEREDLYKKCIPILKQLIQINNKNSEAIRTLMNIYGTIGDNDGFKEMKSLME